MNYTIGVDLGGSHVACGCVSIDGEITGYSERPVDRTASPEKIISEDVCGVIRDCLEKNAAVRDGIKGIGIGIPGRTDSKNGICVFAPNLGWRDVNVSEPVSREFGLPVFILNDARAMAVGEKHFGNGKGCDNFVCIAVGTGVGGGIVAGGRLLLGANEAAGEIGHITVEPEGPVCGCGNHGCAEALASRLGIVRRAEDAIDAGAETILARENLSSKDIYDAAVKGDRLSLKIWEDTGIYLGRAIANIATTVNPERILFSGRVSNAWEFFLPALKKELKERARMVPVEKMEFMKARFEDNAGIVGNAGRAFECLGLLK